MLALQKSKELDQISKSALDSELIKLNKKKIDWIRNTDKFQKLGIYLRIRKRIN